MKGAYIVHERIASSINDAIVVDGRFCCGADYQGMHAALNSIGGYCHNPVIGVHARLIASIEGCQGNSCSGNVDIIPA